RLGENLANPDNVGSARGPGKKDPNTRFPIEFEVETVINFDQAGGSNGEFTPDDQMPGIPGTSDSTDGIAAEIFTFIDLPAGTHTFIVNSDDGFLTYAGNVKDVFRRQNAGEFNGGRGASDTLYRLVVQDAGVYPFRTTWQEGGGGANIEWKTVKADGTRVLVNDTANGGFKAYRASTSGFPTAITSVFPAPGAGVVDPAAALEVQITKGATPVDLASVKLTLDGNPVAATVTKNGSVITAKFQPSTTFPPASDHKATVSYNARTEEWTFRVPPLTKDKVGGIPAFLTGISKWTADKGGFTGAAGDYGIDLGRTGSSLLVNTGAFFNTAAADDKMTVSFWQNRYDVSNGSSFWANSPSSSGSTRGFQAHTPWGDNTIYFDTAGCCAGDSQRISANISTLSTFSGDNSWWSQWRHYAFLKNGEVKQIWIDGVLFHEGNNTGVLPTDFSNLIIGGGPGTGDNLTRGVMDDFAVYNGALSEADIKKLAGKGAANSVSGLVAHWDFNDPIVAPSNVTLKVSVSGANVVVTSDPAALPSGWVIQTSDAIGGPWTTQAGAGTPCTVPSGASAKFVRAAKP
ncbi:MAG: hypothetical protein FJ404_04235, partial [Verrucomicrobia bacterium]|nr:hypothetical protein [Verrucomicrobiota bacterium]